MEQPGCLTTDTPAHILECTNVNEVNKDDPCTSQSVSQQSTSELQKEQIPRGAIRRQANKLERKIADNKKRYPNGVFGFYKIFEKPGGLEVRGGLTGRMESVVKPELEKKYNQFFEGFCKLECEDGHIEEFDLASIPYHDEKYYVIVELNLALISTDMLSKLDEKRKELAKKARIEKTQIIAYFCTLNIRDTDLKEIKRITKELKIRFRVVDVKF